jgi:hypothetical protein
MSIYDLTSSRIPMSDTKNDLVINVPAKFVSDKDKYNNRHIEIPLNNNLMGTLTLPSKDVFRDETPMSHEDYMAGVKPKLDYEVYLKKDKEYSVFQHDTYYRDLENSFESIKMSGADINAAFDKHKANNKRRLNDLESKFGDIINNSNLDKETQFD